MNDELFVKPMKHNLKHFEKPQYSRYFVWFSHTALIKLVWSYVFSFHASVLSVWHLIYAGDSSKSMLRKGFTILPEK